MTDKSKTDAPEIEELSAEDLDAVNGGYLKIGDIAGESIVKRDVKGVVLSSESEEPSFKRERDEKGYLIITMED